MADYDVMVIGAGCGGITAGALLAKQGRKTLVLEQSDLHQPGSPGSRFTG